MFLARFRVFLSLAGCTSILTLFNPTLASVAGSSSWVSRNFLRSSTSSAVNYCRGFLSFGRRALRGDGVGVGTSVSREASDVGGSMADMAGEDGAVFLPRAGGKGLEESPEGSVVAERSDSQSRSPKLEKGVVSAPTEEPSFDQKRQQAVGRVNTMTVVERDDLFREILGVLQQPRYKEEFGGVLNFGGEPRRGLFALRNSSPRSSWSSIPPVVMLDVVSLDFDDHLVSLEFNSLKLTSLNLISLVGQSRSFVLSSSLWRE